MGDGLYLSRDAGKTWKTMGSITKTGCYELMDAIRERLRLYSDPKTGFRPGAKDPQLNVLFDSNDLEQLRADGSYKEMLSTINSTGIMIVDTEFVDETTLQRIGCKPRTAPGTVEIVQVGDIKGNVMFFRTMMDCRVAHQCDCNPYTPCRPRSSCPRVINFAQHQFWEARAEYDIYGVHLPDEVKSLLSDTSIFKTQLGIKSSGSNWGDIERLEALTGLSIGPFLELQNLMTVVYPQVGVTKRRCNLEFLCEQLNVEPPEKVLRDRDSPRRRAFLIDRRKEWQNFTLAEKYFDLVDCLVPALFLLKVSSLIVEREKTVINTTNVLPLDCRSQLLFANLC